jgi:hypothetical protein
MNKFAKVLNDNKITPDHKNRVLLDNDGCVVDSVGDYEILVSPRSQAPHKVGKAVIACATHNAAQYAATFEDGVWF